MKLRYLACGVILIVSHALVFFAASRGSEERGKQEVATGTGAASSAREGRLRHRDQAGPSHAALWQKLLESDMSREDFEKTRAALLSDWARRDLASVLDLIFGPRANGSIRSGMTAAIGEEIVRQPDKVLEWFTEGRFGSRREEVMREWCNALMVAENRGAVIGSLSRLSARERDWVMKAIPFRATAADLDAFRRVLGTTPPEGQQKEQILKAYAQRRAELAGGDVARLVGEETDPDFRRALAGEWTTNRFGNEAEPRNLGQLQDLPEDMRNAAAAAMISSVSSNNYAGVNSFIGEMNRLSMWDAMMDPGTLSKVNSSLQSDRVDVADVFDSLSGIANGDARRAMLQTAGDGIGANVWGEKLEEVVGELPTGADADVFLGGIAARLATDGQRDSARVFWNRLGNATERRGLLHRFPWLAEKEE